MPSDMIMMPSSAQI